MREEVILEVRPGWGPEAHFQHGHFPLPSALHRLHPPHVTVVDPFLGLHECLHIPSNLSEAIIC